MIAVPPPAMGTRRGSFDGTPIGQAFFALLLLGQCALILSIPRFVTVNGPSHLGLATSFWGRLLNPASVVRESRPRRSSRRRT